MDRPQGNSKQAVPPPRRRIQPVPVTQDGLNNAAASNVFNQPLVVPPAPAAGCTKDVSACGKGRRVFVDPESKFEVKWKEVSCMKWFWLCLQPLSPCSPVISSAAGAQAARTRPRNMEERQGAASCTAGWRCSRTGVTDVRLNS